MIIELRGQVGGSDYNVLQVWHSLDVMAGTPTLSGPSQPFPYEGSEHPDFSLIMGASPDTLFVVS